MKRFVPAFLTIMTMAIVMSVSTGVLADEDKGLQVKITADYMVRMEMRDNPDLSNATSDHSDFTGQRLRVNLSGATEEVDYFLQILDGRDWGNERSTGATADDSLDLLQGYIEYGDSYKLRIGRQEITYGKKRLIGSSGWSYKNLPAFDGIRIMYTQEHHVLDAFVVKVAENSKTTNDDVSLYGAAWTWKGGEGWEPGFYALYENDEDDPTTAANDKAKVLSVSSIGWWNIVPSLKFDWEAIYQDGSQGAGDHKANFFHLGLKYTDHVSQRFFIATEYNHASGDDNAADTRNEVFDRQYGINHSNYGYIDYQNPGNMNHLRLSVGGKIRSNMNLQVDYHIFKLVESTDQWQDRSFSGVALQDATGLSGSDVGTELDLTLKIKCIRGINLQVGYSRYFTGSFIDSQIGATVSDSDWGYLMLKKSFK